MNGIFKEIRESCRQVAENSRLVTIESGRLEDYVKSLPLDQLNQLIMDDENHFCGNEDLTVSYFFVLDCINFGSGFFDHLIKTPGKSGYFTIASKLKDNFLELGNFDCNYLQSLTAKDCSRIFAQQQADKTAQQLMQMFATALNELGKFVSAEFSGNFCKILDTANHSAAKLIEILTRMPHYQDQSQYHGKTVLFLKRAQITVSDLNIALNGKGRGYFSDIADLTIFADNLVPHVLWIDGILAYSPGLEASIRNCELLEVGSDEEIELRACAIHAVEMMREEIARQGKELSSQQLDYLLWNQGQAKRYSAVSPHRTRTFFY